MAQAKCYQELQKVRLTPDKEKKGTEKYRKRYQRATKCREERHHFACWITSNKNMKSAVKRSSNDVCQQIVAVALCHYTNHPTEIQAVKIREREKESHCIVGCIRYKRKRYTEKTFGFSRR